jgi:hypothetical protein
MFTKDVNVIKKKLNYFQKIMICILEFNHPAQENYHKWKKCYVREHFLLRVYTLKGGQHGFTGNTINFPQDIETFATTLPRRPSTLPILLLKPPNTSSSNKNFRIRREKVKVFLKYLKRNKVPGYENIVIDDDILNELPNDGYPNELYEMEIKEEIPDVAIGAPEVSNENKEEDDIEIENEIFVPVPTRQQREDDAIENEILQSNPALNWPEVGVEPINEFKTAYLATMCFPTLFANGKGDPTNPVRPKEVKLKKAFEHLLKIAQLSEDGSYIYPFASHPRFKFWALNMLQRHL